MDGLDFARWRDWLDRRSGDLPGKAVFRSDDDHLPGFWIELESTTAIGSFRCWANGLADFDVLDKRTNANVILSMKNEVSNANFETTFAAFVTEFEKVN